MQEKNKRRSCLKTTLSYFAVLTSILFMLPIVNAGYISLQTSISSEMGSSGNGTVAVEITNIGDETAYNVQPRIKIGNFEYYGERKSSLEIKKPYTWNIPFSFSGNNGSYPIIASVIYHDSNSYKFNLKSVGILEKGTKYNSENEIDLELELNERGNSKISLSNNGNSEKMIKISLIAPDEVAFDKESFDAIILPYSSGELIFNVKEFSGLPGSSYAIYVLAEYNENNLHNSVIKSELLNFKELNAGKKLFGYGLSIVILGIFLLLAGISLYFLNLKKWIIDAIVLAAIIIFLLIYFNPVLIFSKTITSGGDTASHYYTAQYMKDNLLPHFKISGWNMGNYAGFPMLQFYFPFPFILMAAISWIIPLEIAFKIITILGIFLLPLAVYFMLRMLDFDFPAPLLGAILTLPFLFNEANSMWGGNIPSTLAGEFSHSISLALSFIFMGTLYRGITKKKWIIINALLFSAAAFSHIYTIFIAALSSLFLLSENFKERFKYLFKMYLLSFLIIASWMIPFLAYLKYTTPYNIKWDFTSFYEVVPKILIPVFAFSIIGIFYLALKLKRDSKLYYLIGPLGLGILLFFSANTIGLVDIRFLSFIYIWCSILGAAGAYYLIEDSGIKLKRIFPLVFLVATIILVVFNVTYIPGWIKWNYEGFEKKQSWDKFSEINSFLKGDINDARVVYEHSTLHNSFGTERAFENLPLFSGRSTLEGLYMQSSISSPYIFYIQSEMSKQNSCPFWNNYKCSGIDIERGTAHLKMFNVGNFIAVSDEIKSLLSNTSEYKLVKTIDDYNIYAVTGNENEYAVPLKYEPVLVSSKAWKKLFYNWFVRGGLDVHLVLDSSSKNKDYNFKILSDENSIDIKNPKKIPIEKCKVDSELWQEEIKIKTDCIGKPVLVKISYHPKWKVEGADRIYLASPSFMLIFPKQNDVRIYYG